MKRWRAPLAVIGLGAVLLVVALRLFNADFSTGETYPEYSTFRADPKGAKLLYESLARVPGVTVSRNVMPLNTLKITGSTVVLLNCDPGEPGIDVLDDLLQHGNRLVIALPEDFSPSASERWTLRHWGLRFEKVAPKAFGADPTWRLSQAIGWTVVEQDGDQIAAAEKSIGKGSIALFATGDAFANRSTYDDDADDLSTVAQAFGDNTHVVFDESHLGIAESGSVIGLAKRFRLTGLAIGFAILAALFIWRNASSFPPARERTQRGAARSASQGLETLLRRHVAAPNLAGDCWREWIATNRREFPEARIARAETAVKDLAANPLAAARRVHEVLYSKGEL